MAAAKKDKTPAKQENHGLPAGLDMDDLEADARSLNPDMNVDDVALPYLYVLQANSPQANPGLPEYVEGAQASNFFNNVSGETYEGRTDGLIFIPCAYERKIVEWVDRDNGGGWVAEHDINSNVLSKATSNSKGKPTNPENGNIYVETAYHYGLMMNPDTGMFSQCVIPLKSTMLKVNRAWNNEIVSTKIPPKNEVTAPRFLYGYNLTTKIATKGEDSWWVLDFKKMDNAVSLEQYKAAKEFAELVSSGVLTRAAENPDGPSSDDKTDGTINQETGEVKE